MTNLVVVLAISVIIALATYKLIAMRKKGGSCAGCQSRDCSSRKS